MKLGERIKAIFEEKGIKLTDFADQIGTVRQNVYRIFERESLDTDLLYKISEVLGHDFFTYYKIPGTTNAIEFNEDISINELALLKDELESAKKEIEYLKKIVSMREEEKQLMESKYKTQQELSETIIKHLREKEKSYLSHIQSLNKGQK